MALSSLWKHRKFRQLVSILKSRALAAGVLECMWSCGCETGDDLLGSADDVEEACGWGGKKGSLTPVLLRLKWIDETRDGFVIHDFFDHCPRYVKRRIARRAMDSRQAHNDRPMDDQWTPVDRQYPTQPNQTQPNPTKPHPPPTPNGRASGFEDFWKIYPRRVGRESALRAWLSVVVNGETPAILDALSWQTASGEWRREGGRYVPKPETYLFDRRWTDERPPDHVAKIEDELAGFLGPERKVAS